MFLYDDMCRLFHFFAVSAFFDFIHSALDNFESAMFFVWLGLLFNFIRIIKYREEYIYIYIYETD